MEKWKRERQNSTWAGERGVIGGEEQADMNDLLAT